MDPDCAEEVIGALYHGLLERPPTDDELTSWLLVIEKGLALEDVIRQFGWSPERSQLLEKRPRQLPQPTTNRPPITILDVGAQALEAEQDVYQPLVDAGQCRVVGIEPLDDKTTTQMQERLTVSLPYFAGDGSRSAFYRTAWSPTSSLYEPNAGRIKDFVGLANICEVVEKSVVQTVRLDDVLNERVDFMKLDVQGAELDVLKGAERLLTGALVVQTEVEFFPIYRCQPLFDTVFGFLIDRGFELFDFHRLVRYSYEGAENARERLLWADAIFIPAQQRIDLLDRDGIRRLGAILRDCYGAVGFSEWLARRYELQGDSRESFRE